MAQTASTMLLPLGATAPSFDLADPSGRRFSLESFDGSPALLVAFICSHCPFVKHVRAGFAVARGGVPEARGRGRGDRLQRREGLSRGRAGGHGGGGEGGRLHLPLPLRRDAGGGEGLRGGVHAGLLPVRPRAAALLPRADGRQPAGQRRAGDRARTCARRSTRCSTGRPAPEVQRPSLGCNIKWKPGNEPVYFPR